MQEELISFNTAKLAKEKGYDEVALLIYYDPPKNHSVLGPVICGPGYSRHYNYYKNKPKDGSERIHANTQSLLQKWLREKYNINVLIEFDSISYGYRLIYVDERYTDKVVFEMWDSYEEALEMGLQEALKLLPDKK